MKTIILIIINIIINNRKVIVFHRDNCFSILVSLSIIVVLNYNYKISFSIFNLLIKNFIKFIFVPLYYKQRKRSINNYCVQKNHIH